MRRWWQFTNSLWCYNLLFSRWNSFWNCFINGCLNIFACKIVFQLAADFSNRISCFEKKIMHLFLLKTDQIKMLLNLSDSDVPLFVWFDYELIFHNSEFFSCRIIKIVNFKSIFNRNWTNFYTNAWHKKSAKNRKIDGIRFNISNQMQVP